MKMKLLLSIKENKYFKIFLTALFLTVIIFIFYWYYFENFTLDRKNTYIYGVQLLRQVLDEILNIISGL